LTDLFWNYLPYSYIVFLNYETSELLLMPFHIHTCTCLYKSILSYHWSVLSSIMSYHWSVLSSILSYHWSVLSNLKEKQLQWL